MVSKTIEDLDRREKLCGFNHNKRGRFCRGFETMQSMILVRRATGKEEMLKRERFIFVLVFLGPMFIRGAV